MDGVAFFLLYYLYLGVNSILLRPDRFCFHGSDLTGHGSVHFGQSLSVFSPRLRGSLCKSRGTLSSSSHAVSGEMRARCPSALHSTGKTARSTIYFSVRS